MDFTETKVVKVRIYRIVNVHIASEISAQSNFFCIAKNKGKKKEKREKKRKKEKLKFSATPGVDRGTLERQRCSVPLSYVNITCTCWKKLTAILVSTVKLHKICSFRLTITSGEVIAVQSRACCF